MASSNLIRGSGLALILGGISFGLFMLLHPFDQLAGAHGAESATWVPAHTFHFLGALFTLFGLVGLYTGRMKETGWLGLLAFVVAFIGTAMFVGTGMITAYIWPVIARTAPTFVDPDGPMFTDPLAFGTISVTYGFLAVGYILLGIVILRSRIVSRWAGLLLIIGVILFSVPVSPVGPAPWIVRVIGALVFGAGLAWLGYGLWSAAGKEKRVTQPHFAG